MPIKSSLFVWLAGNHAGYKSILDFSGFGIRTATQL